VYPRRFSHQHTLSAFPLTSGALFPDFASATAPPHTIDTSLTARHPTSSRHPERSAPPHHTGQSPRPLVRVSFRCCHLSTSRLSNCSSGSGLTSLQNGESHLEGGFPLRCFQRLSRPKVATRRCRWRDNRHTSASSTPVLSYWGQRLANSLRLQRIETDLSHDGLNPAHVPL
jgi:hypothetical protein